MTTLQTILTSELFMAEAIKEAVALYAKHFNKTVTQVLQDHHAGVDVVVKNIQELVFKSAVELQKEINKK